MDINKDPTPRTLPAGVCDLTLTAVFKRKENFLYVWDKRMKPPSDHKDRKGVRIWCQALLAPKPEFFSLHQTEIWVIVFLPSLWVDMSGQRVPTDSHWGEETGVWASKGVDQSRLFGVFSTYPGCNEPHFLVWPSVYFRWKPERPFTKALSAQGFVSACPVYWREVREIAIAKFTKRPCTHC